MQQKKKDKKKERKKEHLSFRDIKSIMEERHIYKRGKGGAIKHIIR
ncbi:hypothetical protein [Caloramator sp. ALD01]|nr:hypothetical protein [Caloramator sp. ALD01]